jgi:hypothetical protein
MTDTVRILAIASDLVSDEGENVEYDRAIVEFTSALIGVNDDDVAVIARLIGVEPVVVGKV